MADNGLLRENCFLDVAAILDWIPTQPQFDKSRVCVMGRSYGGFMVLGSLAKFGSRIKCGVEAVGITNFNTFLANTAEYRRYLRREEYGDERDPKVAKFLEAISPLTNAAAITQPILLAQGANDPRVPLHEFNQIRDVIKRNRLTINRSMWTFLAFNQGHVFDNNIVKRQHAQVMVMFLEEHLLGNPVVIKKTRPKNPRPPPPAALLATV